MSGNKEQLYLNLDAPKDFPITQISKIGWKRISVATGRCIGNCNECNCIGDLQKLARNAAMTTISVSGSGSPLLTSEQIHTLRAKRETLVSFDDTDSVDMRIDIPPAPLSICNDDEL